MQRLFTILALAGAAGAVMPISAAAQAGAPTSTIRQVLLYPGGAQVDRQLRVPAGATLARFSCLPAGLDQDALQVQAPAGVNLGELKIERQSRDALPECRRRDPKVLELEKQRDAVNAEISGVDLALGYLKGLSDREAKPGPGLAAGLETLRRNGQELVVRQQALQERLTEIDLQLRAARAAQLASGGEVSVVTLRLSAPGQTELGLSYRLSGAGWQPQYRARLDTTSGALSIERLAQIAQASGEDWVDVKLRLSTVPPRQTTAASPLQPWTLSMATRMREASLFDRVPMATMAAPAPAAPPVAEFKVAVTGSRAATVNFDASVFEGEFGAEYDLPQPVTLMANGERSTVSLGRVSMEAKLLARVQPQTEAAAYLVAEVPRPQGSWPSGPVQLFRDNSLIGQTPLQLGDDTTWSIPFGRDDRLRVRVEPDKREGATTGLIGSRRESVITRQWLVENLRTRPVTLQVLEAAPVAEHEDIRVQTQFTPAVTRAGWRDQPGIQMWELPLAPQQTQRFQAVYRISVPKEAVVDGLP
ncbi:DUF4139 domain-containing protein [Roseateles amylovorans]|uniref:DUF4139 domain-containing protein n=1 Tax=Roseateles amylovorans TaxID=2978473 RepID=A0ABY6B244_9BURK|nr:DUF4139 domain-containing protein [Roseateles amylovorans]UXH78049.1 DUF4139 domain-containing protein [Roseateles amylovorans]